MNDKSFKDCCKSITDHLKNYNFKSMSELKSFAINSIQYLRCKGTQEIESARKVVTKKFYF